MSPVSQLHRQCVGQMLGGSAASRQQESRSKSTIRSVIATFTDLRLSRACCGQIVSSICAWIANGLAAVKYALCTEMALSRDLPEHGLRRGDVVRIIDDYLCAGGREGYSIEVCNAVGATVAVAAVGEAVLQPLESDEIFTIRRMTTTAATTKV
jgi:hypothetical protein